MAGYGYTYRGNSNGNAPQANDWSRTSYSSDHVCRPVIIDAEGRKKPIVGFTFPHNTESYGVRTETIIQHVLASSPSEHSHAQYLAPSSRVEYGVAESKWHKTPSSDFDPPQVEEFIKEVQNEASRPRFGTFSPAFLRRGSPTSTDFNSNAGVYGDQNDFSNKDWKRPLVGTDRRDYYDDYYRKTTGTTTEPTMITSGGWSRPSSETWAAAPDATLTKPTNDINTAIGYLKELAKPTGDIGIDKGNLAKPKNHITTSTGYLKEASKPSVHYTSQYEYAEPEKRVASLDASPFKPTNEINAAGGYLKESVKPTNDISTAMGYLKEAPKPSVLYSPQSRYAEPERWDARSDTSLPKPANDIGALRGYSKEATNPTNDISAANGYLKEAAKPSVIYSPQSRYAEPETWNARSDASLSRPTNDISTARGYLKEAVKPTNEISTTYGEKPSVVYAPQSRYAEPETRNARSDTSLSRPTNDISTAREYLKEAAKPTNEISTGYAKPSVIYAPQSRYAEPAYTETIDSKEAAKRYGKFNFPSRPVPTENYTRTIDSREAAKKYHGTTL